MLTEEAAHVGYNLQQTQVVPKGVLHHLNFGSVNGAAMLLSLSISTFMQEWLVDKGARQAEVKSVSFKECLGGDCQRPS